MKNNALGQAPLAPDVTYEGPTTPRREGKAVGEYLATVIPAINDLRIRQHIVEGAYVVSIIDLDTTYGAITVCECFRLSNGLIKEIRAFYDPRSITRPESPS